MCERITVLKFGGSVLRGENDLAVGVHEVYRWLRQGRRVVVVVSAFEGTTDALVARARGYTDAPSGDAHALLLSTGECTTAALLCLALARAGVPAWVLGPHALGLRTRGKWQRWELHVCTMVCGVQEMDTVSELVRERADIVIFPHPIE